MGQTGDRPEGYASFIFKVSIGNEEIAAFKECTGPSVEMEVFEYEEGGGNGFVHKLPGRWKVGNITLKRGICKADKLWDWCEKAMQAAISGKWAMPRQDISIELSDPAGAQVRSWKFNKAYPVKWSAPTFKADENSVAVEELELAHDGLQVGTG